MNERTFQARDVHKLEDPERLTWLPPEEVMARIGPVPGMTIADVGTGTGYFALPFARAVGMYSYLIIARLPAK
jgi:2-polyprenyl-3-methyl-5-hydroxy-6-metoxy-1,4-benzoquinol methylase